MSDSQSTAEEEAAYELALTDHAQRMSAFVALTSIFAGIAVNGVVSAAIGTRMSGLGIAALVLIAAQRHLTRGWKRQTILTVAICVMAYLGVTLFLQVCEQFMGIADGLKASRGMG